MDTLIQHLHLLRSLPSDHPERRWFLRRTAEDIVELRLTRRDYRQRLGEALDEAGFHGDERTTLGSSLRYHIQDVLRARLPADQVSKLALLPNPAGLRQQLRDWLDDGAHGEPPERK